MSGKENVSKTERKKGYGKRHEMNIQIPDGAHLQLIDALIGIKSELRNLLYLIAWVSFINFFRDRK